MYLHHELREVAEHRQTEALARIGLLHGLMQQSPGFLRSLACRYLGNTSQYMWLRMWRSVEDHAAFRETAPAADFAATRPEGLYWQLPNGIAPGAHWRSVLEAGKQGDGATLLRIVFSVPKDLKDDFLTARTWYDEAALASRGIASIITFESLESPSEGFFITLMRARHVAMYRNFLEDEATDLYTRDVKAVLKPILTECYEIVDEKVGK
jgi:heme-degrading monooxygenase HmoA